MSELLPCPFCGGEAELVEGEYGMYLTGYAIYCKGTCGAKLGVTGRLCEAYEWTPYFDTEAEAIAAWNKRVKHYPESLAQRMIADGYEYELFELRKECDNFKANNEQLYILAGEQAAKIDELTDECYRYKLQCERYEAKIDNLETLI